MPRHRKPRSTKSQIGRANSATPKTIAVNSSEPPRPQRNVGLARAISKMGYCSRSRAEDAIRAGRVRVNGALRHNVETPVHIGKDRVEIDGLEINKVEKIFLMLNKPRGVVTTASDERGRETIYSFLGKYRAGSLNWVAPVGRLDKASEGLLLITNDSEWAAKITAPETHIDKIYHVQIAGQATPAMIEKLQQGFTVKDGEFLRVKRASVIRSGERNCWLEIVLDEGRNRHIRRMFETIGIEVLRLIRVAIGALKLGDLPKGEVRAVSAQEKLLLFKKANGD
ncbi:MAG TPA: pseudouridine synthase [Candidatus Acidoferrum sp.]|jgi:23S rRNA pseudouridine2605 synthase|nr:pseudouridine synthase [Candidatus Acidoferrum sp.]